MVGNQRPRIAQGLRMLDDFSESPKEVVSIGIAVEYRNLFNASDHDVVQCTRSFDSRFRWHDPST